MRKPVWILLWMLAGSAIVAPAQTLSFSTTEISTSATFTGYTQGVAVGDFNGDGKPDLALATNGGPDHPQVIVVLLGNGDGTFQPGVVYQPTGRSPQTVVVADFNGDGKPDLAVPDFYISGMGISATGDISVLLGNGDGTFQPAVSVPVGDQAAWLAVGDFNKDGKLDLAVASPNSNRIEVLLGNGNGTFQQPVMYPVGKQPDWIVAADVNGDGKLDLATANYGSNDVSVLLGNGDGTFGSATSVPAGVSVNSGVVGDFNGDGKLDLALTGQGSGKLVVLLGNGNGTFQPPTQYAVEKNPNAVAMADFDGDGKMDLAVTDAQAMTNGLAVLRGNGDGTFQPPVYFDGGQQPSGVAVGDFNRDGKPDLAVTNPFPSGMVNVSVLLNTRAAAATFSSISAASYAGSSVAPDELVAGFGQGLATSTLVATTTPLPTELNSTEVQITDSAGVSVLAPLVFVSAGQVNYLVPSTVATGAATIKVINNGTTVATGTLQISRIAPGIFTASASGQGVPAAQVLFVNGTNATYDLTFETGTTPGTYIPKPIDLSQGSVYLELYGTGIRGLVGGTSAVTAAVGGVDVKVLFAGAQGSFAGLDQVNLGPLPASLAGKGTVNLILTVENQAANTVQVAFK